MIPACNYCSAFLAEIYSYNVEAQAIQQDLTARIASGVGINQNSGKWCRLALDRWTNSASNLSEHLATHRLLPNTTAAGQQLLPSPHPPSLSVTLSYPRTLDFD
jgi:hypothetical protein